MRLLFVVRLSHLDDITVLAEVVKSVMFVMLSVSVAIILTRPIDEYKRADVKALLGASLLKISLHA